MYVMYKTCHVTILYLNLKVHVNMYCDYCNVVIVVIKMLEQYDHLVVMLCSVDKSRCFG
jgi:hypothetical protein